uniref:ATP synthase complex subunit 8 n=1 Tax=Sphenomorphus indicus TaxID=96757 RepID=A0A650AV13_9SAUR|nr:ATP synthase F0 subunit 8 [Sphenomorphus indicus]QGP73397.1 ATP synthase subunit 8 [Sphenomorphus indicus]
MPQLNPAPWFFILLLSWITMLLIFKTKVLYSQTPNNTTPKPLVHHIAPWNWPWA